MSVQAPYKDRNIISRSFRLISDGVKDPEKLLRKSDYDLYTCYFSTAIGDNKYVNPVPGWGENTDPGPKPIMENQFGQLGRYYKRIHHDNASLLTLTAGVPEFTGLITFMLNMFDYSSSVLATKGRAPGWAFYITQAASAIAYAPAQILATSFNFIHYLTGTPKNQWYYCKPAMGQYFSAAQGFFNDLMVNAGYTLTVLPFDKQQQGDERLGDRDYGGGTLRGYESDGKIAKDNFSYMHSMFPDAINEDGTIDVLRVCTRGVRKYRYFIKKIKDLDNQFGIYNVDQKDTAIEKILNGLMKDSGFVNANSGPVAGTSTSDYLKKSLATVDKSRGEDEIAYPEVASSYYDADAAANIKPTSAAKQTGTAGSGSITDIRNKLQSYNNESFGVTDNPTKKPPTLDGEVPNVGGPQSIDEQSWLSQIGTLLMDGFYGGLDAVTFRVEGSGSTSDSFGNTTTQSSLASTFNSTVEAIQDFKFNTQAGQTGIDIIDGFVNTIKEGVAGLAAGSVVGNVPLALLGNSKINILEHWADSTTNLHTETFTMYFKAPYAHPYSIATNIFLPLSLLAPFIFPFSTGGSTYTSPFILKAFARGKTIIRTGVVQNASFEFGSGPLGWTTDMKPLNLRVTLTIADLDKVMAVPITRITNPLDLVNMHKQSSRYLGDIGKYNDFISRIAGVDYMDTVLRYNDLNRRMTRFSKDVNQMFSASNVAGVVNDSIVGDIARIFTGRPLNR